MAVTQLAPIAPEKWTPYDEFNVVIPRETFPAEGMTARAAQAIVNSFAWTDSNPMLNLSSFVTTYAEPEAVEVARTHMYKNYIDHDMYPQVSTMERLMVNWLHNLWNGPKGVEPYGTATIGSSEACMLGGLAHKWNWREARRKAGKSTSTPNMVTGGNVQIVWKKFMRYFDVEPRIVPLKPGNYRLTTDRLEKYVDENTICVVAIAGQTFTGEDDDFQGIHDWLDDYEKRTGVSVPMHIDGASGGFVNPFLYPDYKWDFRLPRVKSINASGHKFGLVPPGLGWVVFRERKIFNEDLVFYVNYLGGEMPTATLNFSRGTATIAVQAYMMLRLGREGYTRIMRHTLDNAIYLRQRLVDSGYFVIMNETQRIPVVALTLNKKFKNFNEFDVSNKVRERGWVLSAYAMPPDAQEINSLRIVVRPHLNHTVMDTLANDIIKACQYLEKHGGTATPPQLHGAHQSAPSVEGLVRHSLSLFTPLGLEHCESSIAAMPKQPRCRVCPQPPSSHPRSAGRNCNELSARFRKTPRSTWLIPLAYACGWRIVVTDNKDLSCFMSSFTMKTLDNCHSDAYCWGMRKRSENSVASIVRKGIEDGGPGELWTYANFKTLPLMAVAAALSRLVREGTIRRVRKGVYYSPRKTRFGELSPDPISVAAALLKDKGIDWRPSGLPAYNGLGLTTQVSPTLTLDVPEKIYSLRTGSDARLRLRPGVTVSGLSDTERAVLDALRDLRRIPDSTPAEAAKKIRDLFAAKRFSFNRLARRSLNEPPRVRALLGAIGTDVGADRRALTKLRKSLNPMTTFRLGVSEALPSAKEWRIQ